MRKIITLLMVITLLVAVVGCTETVKNTPTNVDTQKDTNVVATVGDLQVTEADVVQFYENNRPIFLEEVIGRKLLESFGLEHEIEITEERIDEEIAIYKESYNTEELFNQFIKDNRTTEEGFRQSLKDMLLRTTLVEKIKENIEVDESELLTKYNADPDMFNVVDIKEYIIYNKDVYEEAVKLIKSGVSDDEILAEIDPINISVHPLENISTYYGMIGEELIKKDIGEVMEVSENLMVYVVEGKRETFDEVKDNVRHVLIDELKYTEFEEMFNEYRNQLEINYVQEGE